LPNQVTQPVFVAKEFPEFVGDTGMSLEESGAFNNFAAVSPMKVIRNNGVQIFGFTNVRGIHNESQAPQRPQRLSS
jgi:hypothetical protein